MSKSDPNSAIFMEDSEADVNLKIKRAFCPPNEIVGNPCIAYVKHIVLPWFGTFTVTRKPDNGGDVTYETIDALEADYAAGTLHPGDLKPALARQLNVILEPVRKHFETDPQAKALLAQIKKYKVTK